MPEPLVWTESRDTTLCALRSRGAPWDAIARALGISRWAAIQRARRLGAHTPFARTRLERLDPLEDPDRPPLPPGHPVAWAVITEGTLLEGTAYPGPAHGPLAREPDLVALAIAPIPLDTIPLKRAA